MAGGQDVGATGVFRPVVDGRPLTFQARGGGFVDRETASRWNVLGRATRGPLAGATLEPVVHVDTFWFAWAAFQPDTVIVPDPEAAGQARRLPLPPNGGGGGDRRFNPV